MALSIKTVRERRPPLPCKASEAYQDTPAHGSPEVGWRGAS